MSGNEATRILKVGVAVVVRQGRHEYIRGDIVARHPSTLDTTHRYDIRKHSEPQTIISWVYVTECYQAKANWEPLATAKDLAPSVLCECCGCATIPLAHGDGWCPACQMTTENE